MNKEMAAVGLLVLLIFGGVIGIIDHTAQQMAGDPEYRDEYRRQTLEVRERLECQALFGDPAGVDKLRGVYLARAKFYNRHAPVAYLSEETPTYVGNQFYGYTEPVYQDCLRAGRLVSVLL